MRNNSTKVVVRTFLHSAEEGLVGIEESRAVFGRDLYVQGSVELCVDGVVILARDDVDTIDSLWSFFLACLDDFLKRGYGVLRFPECAYVLTLKRVAGGRVVMKFEGPNKNRSALGGEREVIDGLLLGAVEFFQSVLDSSPRDEWGYRRDLGAALLLRSDLLGS
ncbi:hypothetical protein ACIQK9_12390 [Streptomyces hydrogenans]|uniref:hypothetical protein n=1 Tax=Streptomyces hydrogenans TaxID=1873719 RepID=UPI00381EB3FF